MNKLREIMCEIQIQKIELYNERAKYVNNAKIDELLRNAEASLSYVVGYIESVIEYVESESK